MVISIVAKRDSYFVPCSTTSIVDFEHVMPAGIIQKFCISFQKNMCAPLSQRKQALCVKVH